MEFKYELTKEDLLAFNLYHAKQSETVKSALFKQRFLVPIIFLLLPFILYWITGEFLIEVSISFMLVSILWLVFYPKYFYGYIKRNVSKVLDEGNNDNLLGNHLFTMAEDGFTEKSNAGETKVPWSGITKVEENEEYYFLFYSAMSAYIIPKRCLIDKTEQAEFKQLLRKSGFRV